MTRKAKAGNYQRIEFPCSGSTYHYEEYGVYEYGTYPRSSVLAGQQQRIFHDRFPTLAEAQAAYPEAEWVDLGSHYHPVSVSHLPDEDDMETYERECLLMDRAEEDY